MLRNCAKYCYLLLMCWMTAKAQTDAPTEAEVEPRTETHTDSLTEAEADSLRMRDDFVTASLLVTSPGEKVYSALGHCVLRMECPTYHLDYCFSFELHSGNDVTDYLLFFSGQAPAGVHAMETEAYLQNAKPEGRSVTQYTLNLTPVQKQELWRRLDNNMMEGVSSHFDFIFHNCTSTCLTAIESQLLGEQLVVKEWPDVMNHGLANSLLTYTRNAPWMQFVLMSIWGTVCDAVAPFENSVAPEVIAEVFEHAVIVSPDGTERPALTGEPRQLLPQTLVIESTWFTPLLVATVLLVLMVLFTIGERLCGWFRVARVADICLLVLQAMIGAVLLYLVMVSNLFGQRWNWCLLLFSPMPFIVWLCFRHRLWYRRLALVYGCVLLLLALASPLVTEQLITAHRLLAAAIAVRCISCGWTTHNTSQHHTRQK